MDEPVAPPSPSSDPRAPRWRRRKEARPAEILEAALELFVQRGFAGARLEDIAHRANCTKSTIFLYYAGKAELFKATVRHAMVPMLEAAEHSIDDHQGSHRELLVQLLRQRWSLMVETPLSGLTKLMYSEAAEFPDLARFYHDEVMIRSLGVIERVLAEGVVRGEFRPMDTRNVAPLALAPIMAAAMWRNSFGVTLPTPVDFKGLADTAIAHFLRGIDVHPESANG
ncbi:MAG: TetR/AcrR family transcriptional regulator [bacterium]